MDDVPGLPAARAGAADAPVTTCRMPADDRRWYKEAMEPLQLMPCPNPACHKPHHVTRAYEAVEDDMGGGVWRIFCAGCNMRGPGVRVHSNTPRDEQQWASARSEELWNALPRKMSLPEWQSEPPFTDDGLVLVWHTRTLTYTVLHQRESRWFNGRGDASWDREELIALNKTQVWLYRAFNAYWPGSEAVFRHFLDWRALDPAAFCPECQGAGRRAYGCTSTWAGGIGGMQITADICDKCWGSGNDRRPGVNLRALQPRMSQKTIPDRPANVDAAAGVDGGGREGDQRMSEYLGQPATALPDGGFHEHEPGRWCLAMWERRKWGRSMRSWKLRATAVKRFCDVANKLHPGARLALVDGTGLVRAYAELGTKEMAAMLQQMDWVRLEQKHPDIVDEVYRRLRVCSLGLAL